MASESPRVRQVLDAVAAYGEDAFLVESQQPNTVVLSSAADNRLMVSIVAIPDRCDAYSVMVELDDPPDPQWIPFEIAACQEGTLAEVVELLGRYREWRRT